jgi:fructose-specific phosphotransferase system IIA component
MILTENLHENGIIVHSSAKSRWDVIKELVSLAAGNGIIPAEFEEEIQQALIAREKTMTTGIGKGVAIPHCKLTCIKDIILLMATSHKGINFDSIDNLPAKIIVMLLVPANKADKHVKVLSSIARILSDEDFKQHLTQFENKKDLLEYVHSYEKVK